MYAPSTFETRPIAAGEAPLSPCWIAVNSDVVAVVTARAAVCAESACCGPPKEPPKVAANCSGGTRPIAAALDRPR